VIEINLSTAQKGMDLTNIGGYDFSKIKVKYIFFSLILLYLPDIFISDHLESEFNVKQAEFDGYSRERDDLKNKVNSLKDFEKQINALEEQEKKLREKLGIVKTIMSQRINPWNILVYISKNIPPEIWLTSLEFRGTKITLRGVSNDYSPQGLFLENLKKSIFFDRDVVYKKIANESDRSNRALAPFEIELKIVRYE
jgi:Tfp pilus assembly protein PilN